MHDPEIEPSEALRPLVLALDLGTTSARIQLHDARGTPLAGTLGRRRTQWTTDASGGVWTDARVLLRHVEELLDALVRRHGDLLRDVTLGGSSCLFHSFCGVDAERRPVTPLRSWADTSAAAADALGSNLDAESVRQRTGAPLHPGYWPARIAAAKRPRDVRGWAGLPELLHHRLTGEWTLGRSLASGTGLRNRSTEAWDPELCEAIGVDAAMLPSVVTQPNLKATGDDAVARWPELAHVRWLPPIGDGVCNNVGLGAIGNGRAALMIGTSSAMRTLRSGSVEQIPEGLFAYGVEGDRTLYGGALSEGGGTAAWWARLAGRDIEALAAGASAPTQIAMLPYLTGERGPRYHASATGALTGLRLSDDAAAIMRALMAAVALGLADIDAALGSPASVTATGGALRPSATWQRLVAGALGRPIDVARLEEPSLRGAALLALEAGGVAPITAAPPVTTDRVEAHAADIDGLDVLRQRRRKLYQRLVAAR